MSATTVADDRTYGAKAYDAVIKPFRMMGGRTLLMQIFSLALVVCTALMIWKSLMVATGSESPVVVVLSGSMEPTFYKGDILFLNLGDEPFTVGEIIVFKVENHEIPIVHRILEVHEDADGNQQLLTKGDNNDGFDRPIYARGRSGKRWLTRSDVLGRARGFLPHVGHVTIIMTEFPVVKYALLGIMAFFVITTKGE